MRKTVSIDIDGVLNFYPKPWLEYIRLRTDRSFATRDEAKDQLGDVTYNRLKEAYRTSEFKENLPVNEESVAFLKKLKEAGFSIIISTSRPIANEKYPDLFQLTKRWLTKKDIPFDHILFKCDNDTFYEELGQVLFHVDDEYKYAEMLSKRGIKVYWFQLTAEATTTPLIQPVESLWQINDYESFF